MYHCNILFHEFQEGKVILNDIFEIIYFTLPIYYDKFLFKNTMFLPVLREYKIG